MSNILEVCSTEQKKTIKELKITALIALLVAVGFSFPENVDASIKIGTLVTVFVYIVVASGLAALKIAAIDLALAAKVHRDNDALNTHLLVVDRLIFFGYILDLVAVVASSTIVCLIVGF